MDKQKQIEEMAKIIKETNLCGFACDTCKYKNISVVNDCKSKLIAEELLKHYQPKIPKNAVVLKKEEYESVKDSVDLLRENESVSNSLIKSNELCRKLIDDKKELKRQLEQARKETAEKFAELAKELLDKQEKGWSANMIWIITAKNCIDEIAKEITEGEI